MTADEKTAQEKVIEKVTDKTEERTIATSKAPFSEKVTPGSAKVMDEPLNISDAAMKNMEKNPDISDASVNSRITEKKIYQEADKQASNIAAETEMENETETPGEDEIGYIELADEVLAIVAKLAALDVAGILDMSSGFREGINNFFGKKSPAKGVRVSITGKSCRIAVYVVAEYGYNLPELAMKVQKKVRQSVNELTDYEAETVDVHIEGVMRRPKSNLEESFSQEEGRDDGFYFNKE